jgi:site-specific recombinase XerD
MTNTDLLGPWLRRFLLEHLVTERNLARNTQCSYRDALALLVPFLSAQTRKEADELTIDDVSADRVRQFLRRFPEKNLPF